MFYVMSCITDISSIFNPLLFSSYNGKALFVNLECEKLAQTPEKRLTTEGNESTHV